jgi:hypothetical protein
VRLARPLKCPNPCAPSRPEGRETTLLGFSPLRHIPTRRIRFIPGIPLPGTFRPQGLATLPAASSPPRLATARRPPQRPWGSPFRALLPPASGASLEASPLMSFFQSARRRVVATPEVDSGGRGARLAAARRRRRPNLALLGLRPSKAFSSDHLRPGFPDLFPHDLLLGMLPTDHAQPGLQGVFSGGSGLVSHETACLPGVLHLVDVELLRATRAPGLWLRLGPVTLASKGLLGTPDCPT